MKKSSPKTSKLLTVSYSMRILNPIRMVKMEIDIDQMNEIIRIFEDSSLTEITVERDNYRLTLKKDSGTETTDSSSEAEEAVTNEIRHRVNEEDFTSSDQRSSQAVEEETPSQEGFYITSPIVGTFYSSPSPDDAPYVEVGDVVHEGDTVCVVEAMKVMNEVDAEAGGRVVEVCVEDGDPVEFAQELYKLVPVENS